MTVGIVDLHGIDRFACALSQFSEKQCSQVRSKRILRRLASGIPERIGHATRIALRHARAHRVLPPYALFTCWRCCSSFGMRGFTTDLAATFDTRKGQRYRYTRPRDPSQPRTSELQLTTSTSTEGPGTAREDTRDTRGRATNPRCVSNARPNVGS